jgi:hypothetical protein
MSVKLPRNATIPDNAVEFSAVAHDNDGVTLLIGLLVLAAIFGAIVVVVMARLRDWRRRGRP